MEKISGVRYLAVKSRDLTELREEAPLDERIGPEQTVEMTPELAAQVQEQLREHYMKWLDSPLPLLDGNTPRELTKTEAGRKKVAMLIRAIPAPTGNPGIVVDIPRDEMLRELGLA